MKASKATIVLAVLSVFLIPQGLFIVNPALKNLAEAFPQIPYTTVLLLSTLPSLVVVPFTIIAGAVVGTKIKYRTLLAIATVLFAAAGAAPFFMRDFYAILGARVVFGIGVGLGTPLGNALVMRLFDGQKKADMLGIGTAIMNVGGIVFQTLSGIVCSINVNYTWLVHLLAAITLLLVLAFLPEPEKAEQVAGEKVKMPIGVYLISAAYAFTFMLFYPVLLNMSAILIGEHLGSAAAAGTILSMYTVGGMIGGAIFGKAFKITGKYLIPLSLIIQVLGLGVCNYSHDIIMFAVGTALTGIALFLIMPAVFMEFGMMVPPTGFALASGIMMGFLNFSGFLASSYMGLLSKITGSASPRLPIFVGMMVTIVITVVWGLVKMRQQPAAPQSLQV